MIGLIKGGLLMINLRKVGTIGLTSVLPPKAAKFVSSSMNAPIGVRRRRVHSVTRKPANAFGATTHAPPMTKNAKTKRFGHA